MQGVISAMCHLHLRIKLCVQYAAYLVGAYLVGAYLVGAYLVGATNLSSAIGC